MWRSPAAYAPSGVLRQAVQKVPKDKAAPFAAGVTIATSERFQLPERFKALSSEVDRPVYFKRSSSPHRRPSFYIPRMRDPDDLIKMDSRLINAGDGLGTAMPLFSIASSSCDYYALRLPLLKAGFKRVLSPPSGLATNVIWGKSMPFRRFRVSRKYDDGSESVTHSLRFAEATTPEQQQHIDSLTMVNGLQQFNHFPLSHRNLGSKKGMANNIALTAAAVDRLNPQPPGAGEALYKFVPRTWFYPAQRAELEQVFRDSPPSRHFIWKPSLGSCGRGICFSQGGPSNAKSWARVMRRIDEKAADEEHGKVFRQYVVQDYVENPLLLEGRKMDLRLYVAVTSYDPLMLYVHEEGLVRLAAAVYDDSSSDPVASAVPGAQLDGQTSDNNDGDSEANSMEGRFKHLTNYSIGRKYGSVKHREGTLLATEITNTNTSLPELKWSFEKLWSFLDANAASPNFSQVPAGMSPSAWVREQISLLIVRTFMSAKPTMVSALREVQTSGHYFELYGVDVMLDAKLNPWLIEINTLPSLESSSAFDYATKTNVVSDLLNIAMLEPFVRPLESFSGYRQPQNGQAVRTAISPRMAKLLGGGRAGVAAAATPTRIDTLTPVEQRAELKSALDDAFQYARGFKRIFPPVSTSTEHDPSTVAQYPLRVGHTELSRDIELFAKLGVLTDNDQRLLSDL